MSRTQNEKRSGKELRSAKQTIFYILASSGRLLEKKFEINRT